MNPILKHYPHYITSTENMMWPKNPWYGQQGRKTKIGVILEDTGKQMSVADE